MGLRVSFIAADGDRIEADANEGDNLLRLAQSVGLPLEGTCEGQMACSTCHVYIAADWFDRLPPASEDEEDMLELAAEARANSRLACQIALTDALHGLEVKIPAKSSDARLF